MIEVRDLTRRYGGRTVVDRVSFHCEPGTVTGFLGPNGAGKSTTLRMICGLTRPTSGSTTVDGVPYRDLPSPGLRVGVLLDASALHAGRTGAEALSVSAMTLGVPRQRVSALLDLVGLSGPHAGRRVGAYSLGMRQRLGLAMSLLGDPSVLVLDEPANGLDPEGISWMRGLLRDFADRGGTVLLSSHLLREVLADHLVVIRDGRVVAGGPARDLLGSSEVLVRSTAPEELARALDRAGLQAAAGAEGALLVEASLEQVGRVAAEAGVVVTELRAPDGAGLEHLFLELTGAAGRNGTKEAA